MTTCAHIHTQFSTHTYLFLYSGQLDPSSQIRLSCFSSSQQRHGRGVVASQSVAACGFSPLSLCYSFGPACSLPNFLFASFVYLFLLPPISYSVMLPLSLALSLFIPLSPSSVLIEVQYCMRADCCPSLSPISAAYHSACRLLSMGRPGFCII